MDVAMEEVEDMKARGANESQNEMEICNFVDTTIVGEWGRGC